jgi:hypothetical protein
MPPPVPAITAGAERASLAPAAASRLAGLVTAAWAALPDRCRVSRQSRKGPRGGGRDRDQLIGHVMAAETAYARKLGIKLKRPAAGDTAAIENCVRRSPPRWAPPRTAHPWYPAAGPRVTRPGGSPGMGSNTPGRCRTGAKS